MSQFRIDPDTGDLARSAGSFERVEGLEEIRQHIRLRLLLYRGECPLNTSLGMAYFSPGILDKGVTTDQREAAFREAIEQTPGVDRVEDVTVSIDNSTRVLTVEFLAFVSIANRRETLALHDKITATLAAAG